MLRDSSFNLIGLRDSGVGIFWIKKENGKYIYYHTEYSALIYGLTLEQLPPAELYGDNWKEIYKKVALSNSAYGNLIKNSKRKLLNVLNGKKPYETYTAPWIDVDENEIWVSDKVYIVDYDTDGTAKTVVGVTINESLRTSRREHYKQVEEINVKLRSAEERAVHLAGLLVWSMNFEEFPKGDYIFSNDEYGDVLGLSKDANGYIAFADFLKTTYDDEEGKNSMSKLLLEFRKANENKQDEYLGLKVKHKNLMNNEPIYLDHYTQVDERFEDGKIKRISGYIVDITKEVQNEKAIAELDKKNRDLILAQKLAVNSGQVLIWYLNDETTEDKNYYYGNDTLFETLGIPRYNDNFFLISEFNQAIYYEDEEGKELYEKYLKMDDAIEMNESQGYTKVLVKHRNLITNKIMYLEHNFIVEERYDDNTLKIRGGYMTDITQETLYRKEVEYLSKHDSVTGLNNRNMFEIYIKSPDLPSNFSIIVIDIDGLKFINDAYGHILGDKAIKLTSRILREVFEEDSTLYRIGGDEFTIITLNTNSETLETRLSKVKNRITEETKDTQLIFNVSVGYEIVDINKMDFTSAFTIAENNMYRSKLSVRNSRKSQTLETVLETLDSKTEETKAHCDRLATNAVNMLKALGYTRANELDDMKILCQVHDIGKITISEEILSKETELTDEEYEKIKAHSEAGYKIVRNIVESDVIAEGVLYHHEHCDGTGYPFGLKCEEIPLYAKVLSICDAYDVIVEGRSYQEKKTHEEAIEEIKRCSGTQFDSKLVEVFINLFK